jgi:hypothetical protein
MIISSRFEQKGLAPSATNARLPAPVPGISSTLGGANSRARSCISRPPSARGGNAVRRCGGLRLLADLAGAPLEDAAPVVEEDDADPHDLPLDEAWEDKLVTFG